MVIRPGWICAFGFAIVVSACGGADINRLDANLVDTYRIKQASLNEDERLIFSYGIRSRFAQIAEEAEEAAGKLDADDLLNKTSLYRIAATARWQSLDLPVVIENTDTEAGESKLANTFTYTSTVEDLCGRQWRDGRRIKEILPRDCLLVQFIPAIADNDGAIMKFEAAKLRWKAIPKETDPQKVPAMRQTVLADYRAAYGIMRNAFIAIAKSRNANLATPVPVNFWRWADRQRLSAYCNALNVTATIGDFGGNQCINDTQDKMADGLKKLEQSLKSSFGNVNCGDFAGTAGNWKEKSITQGGPDLFTDDSFKFKDLPVCPISQ